MSPGDEVAGRYRLEELQGHGPMSEVWRAHDRRLDRTVALKILAPRADLARFQREAQVLAALAHANVMRVYDYGEDEAGPFMALEWLPGGTLEDRLAQGPLPPGEAQRVAAGIAAGLAQLHGRELVHRDLKPANVVFDEEGRPKLADFGLARTTVGADSLTEDGTVLGTAAYISPEQAAGQAAGPASDVYSFGVLLFEMLTGTLPFAADDALALADLHRHAPPPAVDSLQPDVPPALAALTAAALSKDPGGRPPDGAALLSALGSAPEPAVRSADTESTQVLAATTPEPPPRRPRRGAALAAVGLVLLATAGGVLAWAVTRPDTAAPAGPAPKTAAGSHTHTHTHAVATQSTPLETTRTHQQTQPRTTTTHRATTTAPATTRATTTFPATTTTPDTTTTEATTTTTPTTTAPATTTVGVGTTTTATTT